jgi:hypothetical protein
VRGCEQAAQQAELQREALAAEQRYFSRRNPFLRGIRSCFYVWVGWIVPPLLLKYLDYAHLPTSFKCFRKAPS